MTEEYKRWFDSLVMYYAERGMQAPSPENVQVFYDRGATPAEVYESLNMKRATVEAGFEVSDVDPGITQTQVANVSGDQFAPRLTMEQILARVKGKSFTLTDSGTTMLCELVMVNGGSVVGFYSPVADEAVSNSMMQTKALQDALRKVWKYEAYLVREKLYNEWLAAQPADPTAVATR